VPNARPRSGKSVQWTDLSAERTSAKRQIGPVDRFECRTRVPRSGWAGPVDLRKRRTARSASVWARRAAKRDARPGCREL